MGDQSSHSLPVEDFISPVFYSRTESLKENRSAGREHYTPLWTLYSPSSRSGMAAAAGGGGGGLL